MKASLPLADFAALTAGWPGLALAFAAIGALLMWILTRRRPKDSVRAMGAPIAVLASVGTAVPAHVKDGAFFMSVVSADAERDEGESR
jgi:hypothetical protein